LLVIGNKFLLFDIYAVTITTDARIIMLTAFYLYKIYLFF